MLAAALCVVAAALCGRAARAAGPSLSYEPAVAPMISVHRASMALAPGGTIDLDRARHAFMPLGVGTDAEQWFARKSAARDGGFAPHAMRPMPALDFASGKNLTLQTSFEGMADSAEICPYYGGCQPPDMALASSSAFVLQGVNTSFALYDDAGGLETGWPKTMQSMFDVPNPGSCDPSGPFMTDPRALYDPADGRFWVAALQIEGAFGINSCPEQSLMWVGVSRTSDPTGAWNVYAFNMRGFSTNAAEFTMIGLDSQAFYFGANMFDKTGRAFIYEQLFAASKSAMEAGGAVTPLGVKDILFNKTPVDSVQPVLVVGASAPVGLFVDSFNIDWGGGNCLTGCSGINVYAMMNPLTKPHLVYKQAASPAYSLAPLADQPGCIACIETFDTRISATPVYADGLITFALETAVNNGTDVVPGIFWGQVVPKVSGGTLVSAKLYQSGTLSFASDEAASFGALMPDASNNLVMVFDAMSSVMNPGIEYAGRLSTDPLGSLEPPVFLKHGPTHTGDNAWGEFGATSYEGGTTNRIWISAEYSALGGDWGSHLGALHF